MSRKREKMTQEQRLIHSSSPIHLEACKQGSRVYRNKKKYTRKGKSRFSPKDYGYGSAF